MSEVRRRGRPSVLPGERQDIISIRLSGRLQEIARALGDGNISAGIRRALETAGTRKR